MLSFNAVFAGLWLLLLAFWLILGSGAKRNVSGSWSWRREIAWRVVLLIVIGLALRTVRTYYSRQQLEGLLLNTSTPRAVVGIILCALGVGLAIWARTSLGRNWGMPMSQKESPELVMTGPYAYVRHPVYAGFLLAMLGSAIGQSVVWLIPLVGALVYFTCSALREEKLMLAEFPEQYRPYVQRTKRLVPFVW